MALRSRARSTRLLVVGLVSISLATITVDYRQGDEGPLAVAGRAALGFVSPIQEAVSKVTRPIGEFFSAVAELPSLRDENQRLRDELERVRTQLALTVSDQARLERLEQVLGLTKALNPESVAAVVIANGLSNTEWVITIDKGTDDGIREGMPVVTPGGALVGSVVRSAAGSSDVQLIIDVDWRAWSRLVGSRDTGILRGMGDADLRMDLLDPGLDVTADEQVVTAGYEIQGEKSRYPPGILIGTVSREFEDPAALEKFVTVRPAADLSSLEFVLVLLTRAED